MTSNHRDWCTDGHTCFTEEDTQATPSLLWLMHRSHTHLLQIILKISFQIMLNDSLDYERVRLYSVCLGIISVSGYVLQTFHVQVSDVNEPPQCEKLFQFPGAVPLFSSAVFNLIIFGFYCFLKILPSLHSLLNKMHKHSFNSYISVCCSFLQEWRCVFPRTFHPPSPSTQCWLGIWMKMTPSLQVSHTTTQRSYCGEKVMFSQSHGGVLHKNIPSYYRITWKHSHCQGEKSAFCYTHVIINRTWVQCYN